MKSLRDIISDTAFIGFVQIINMFLSLVTIGVIIKYLGMEKYGLITIYKLFTIAGLFLLVDFGIKKPIIREIAVFNSINNNEKINDLIMVLLFFSLVISFILLCLGFYLPEYIVRWIKIPIIEQTNFIKILHITFILTIIDIPSFFILSIYEGLNLYKLLKSIELIQMTLISLGQIILVILGYDYIELIYYFMIITSLFSIYKIFKIYPYIKVYFHFSFMNLKRTILLILKQAKFYAFANMSSILGNHSSNLIISMIFSPSYVAYSDIIQKLPKVIKNAVGFIGQNLMVVTSERDANNDRLFVSKVFNKGLKIYQFILIPLTIIVSVYSYDLLTLWLGDKYLNLSLFVSISVLSIILHPIASFGWSFLNGYGVKLKSMALFQWIVTLLKLSLLLVLSKYIGLWSVVLVMWSYIVVIPKNMEYYKEHLDFKIVNYLKETLKLILIATIISLLLSYIDINRILLIFFTTIIVYILSFIIYFNKDEKEYIYIVIQKINNKIKGKV